MDDQTLRPVEPLVKRPVVLFDGGCPMCSREIAFYRRRKAAERLDWVDISKEMDTQTTFGIGHEKAMQRFHVRDEDGRWQKGAYAFTELWSHFPGWRLLARILRMTKTLPLVDEVYDRFAAWRLKRQCSDGSCSAPSGKDDL